MNCPEEVPVKKYYTNERVRFDFGTGDPELRGTGTILGMPMDNVIQWYIVLLDQPVKGQRALLVPDPQIKEKL